MAEGWLNFDYVVLFSEDVRTTRTLEYKIAKFLPGYTLVGLFDWDYLLVTDAEDQMYTVPSLPLDISMLSAFSLPEDLTLEVDDRYTGKIKWYLKPLALGGNPYDVRNLAWVSVSLHADLVVWWNEKYKKIIKHTPICAPLKSYTVRHEAFA
jgi:hypothetical protein